MKTKLAGSGFCPPPASPLPAFLPTYFLCFLHLVQTLPLQRFSCLGFSSPGYLHGSLPHCLQILIHVSPFQQNLSWLLDVKLPYHPQDLQISPLPSLPLSHFFPGEEKGNPLQYPCLDVLRTEEPSGLQSMGSQRVRYSLAIKQQDQWR